jgi:hypothetical protein
MADPPFFVFAKRVFSNPISIRACRVSVTLFVFQQKLELFPFDPSISKYFFIDQFFCYSGVCKYCPSTRLSPWLFYRVGFQTVHAGHGDKFIAPRYGGAADCYANFPQMPSGTESSIPP